jgi:catechol 2,3-dioxygenase-like lactoylglutathione lyase family enzyme
MTAHQVLQSKSQPNESKMKTIPFLRCLNMKEAIDFYTHVLDFKPKYPHASADDWVVDLVNGDAELGLTALEGDQKLGINVYVRVDEVDDLFRKYLDRGLVVPDKPDSPVHHGPINQSWGMREFYVDDPSGNTLRFGKFIDQ